MVVCGRRRRRFGVRRDGRGRRLGVFSVGLLLAPRNAVLGLRRRKYGQRVVAFVSPNYDLWRVAKIGEPYEFSIHLLHRARPPCKEVDANRLLVLMRDLSQCEPVERAVRFVLRLPSMWLERCPFGKMSRRV